MIRRTSAYPPEPAAMTPSPASGNGGGGGGGNDASVDHGILAFGSSATVNADLRRTIRKDVDEIDAGAHKTERVIGSERKASDVIRKGHRHCEKENAAFRFEAAQTSDSLKVGEQVVRGLQATISTDIASKSNPQDGGGFVGGDGQPPTGGKASMDSIRKGKTSFHDKMDKITCDFLEEIERIRTLEDKKQDVDCSPEGADDCERQLHGQREDNGEHQKVLVHELGRERALIGSKEKLEANALDLEKEVAALTKALDAKKRGHGLAEAEKTQRAAAVQDDEARQEKSVTELDTKLSHVQVLDARSDEQTEGAEAHTQEREKSKQLVERERSSRNKLFSENGEVVSKLTAAKAKLDRDRGKQLEEETLEAAVARIKHDNDSLEAKYHPKREELTDISKELEDASALIVSVEGGIEEAGRFKEEADITTVELEKSKEELAVVSGPLPDKVSEYDDLSEFVPDYRSSELKLEQLLDGSDASRKETRRYEKQHVERSAQAVLYEPDHYLHVVRLGADTLKDTSDKERELEVER